MSAYRESARVPCTHRWATYWRPFGSGIEDAVCMDCGARLAGWRAVAWALGLWDHGGPHIHSRPPDAR